MDKCHKNSVPGQNRKQYKVALSAKPVMDFMYRTYAISQNTFWTKNDGILKYCVKLGFPSDIQIGAYKPCLTFLS